MAYCVKCGAKVDDGIGICPQCGAQIPDMSGSCANSRNSGSYTGYGSDSGWESTYNQSGGQKATYEQSGSQGYAYGQQGYQSGGQEYAYGQQGYQSGGYQQGGYRQEGYQPAGYFDQNEVRQNKAMGVLSYIGILVLIPLLAGNKQSQYVKHHVNQGLVLYILSSLVDLLEGDWVWGLHSIIHFGGGMFSWIFDILGLVFLILMVTGIVTACRGERRELPLIGKIKFFK